MTTPTTASSTPLQALGARPRAMALAGATTVARVPPGRGEALGSRERARP